jgi:hypothetical protein
MVLTIKPTAMPIPERITGITLLRITESTAPSPITIEPINMGINGSYESKDLDRDRVVLTDISTTLCWCYPSSCFRYLCRERELKKSPSFTTAHRLNPTMDSSAPIHLSGQNKKLLQNTDKHLITMEIFRNELRLPRV